MSRKHTHQVDEGKKTDPVKIRISPDPILNKICRADFVVPEKLISEMFTLLRKHDAIGLSAPQVGIDARLFITAWGDVFVNPTITWHSERIVQTHEGCLSFPGIIVAKTRYSSVQIGDYSYIGQEAIVLQHELDHLNGITIESIG